MPLKLFRTPLTLLLTGTMLTSAATAALAETHTLKTSSWGAWTQYSQQESNWCWAAASKMIIQKARGTSPTECIIAKNGKNSSSCANAGGTLAQIRTAIRASNTQASATYNGVPTYSDIRNTTVAGGGFIEGIMWENGLGHAVPIIGSKSSEETIFITLIDTTSVKGVWVSYADFKKGKGGFKHNYTPIQWLRSLGKL
jgi:hypothetical protein